MWLYMVNVELIDQEVDSMKKFILEYKLCDSQISPDSYIVRCNNGRSYMARKRGSYAQNPPVQLKLKVAPHDQECQDRESGFNTFFVQTSKISNFGLMSPEDSSNI